MEPNTRPLPPCMYCPSCTEPLQRNGIKYKVPTRSVEYGDALINDYGIELEPDYDYQDSEHDGDVEHTCGNCEAEIEQDQITDIENLMSKIRAIKDEIRVTKTWVDSEDPIAEYLILNREIVSYIRSHPQTIALNTEHRLYTTTQEIPTIITLDSLGTYAEEPPSEDNEENNRVVAAQHHCRWQASPELENQFRTCPNPSCSHTFMVNQDDQEFTCPRCQQNWDKE